MNPLQKLGEYGQSVWLDYIRRGLISSGELKGLVQDDGLGGVTSNPAIFQKAITGSTDYADILESLQKQKGVSPMALYEHLAVRDIQDAADVLRPVYDDTDRRDGYVSLEVSPYLAHDTDLTVDEARRLWKAVGKENLLIKVPATPEGIPAIEKLIGEGININVTLIFSLEAYEQVAEAYIKGLEMFASRGGEVSKIGSVASFFISRIDSAIEAIVSARMKTAPNPYDRAMLQGLPGKVAIANGKLAYQRYKEIFRGDRWDKLEKMGAKTQRVLWASTGTKNPQFSDVLYVEELIGPDTVNTMPPSTFDAFRDHGKLRPSLEEDVGGAQATMETLEKLGISMKEVTDRLLRDGVRLFSESFDKLLNSVNVKCMGSLDADVNRQEYSISDDYASQVQSTLEEWQIEGKVRRLWSHDSSLWTGGDEGNWLGWLGITEGQISHAHHLTDLAGELKEEGFSHALLMGMGGSSLCPEVLRTTFGKIEGYPELHVLDSTDPAQVKAFEKKIDIGKTIFIVSSKSGTTLEPNIFKNYFFERVKEVVGPDKAGKHFIAITDPGSKLENVAEEEGFRYVFHGVPSIGGRYSALSDFGMVPAAIMGIDAKKFLDKADEMAIACSSCVPAGENPGVVLGAILGVLWKMGRDKVTIFASPGVLSLGAWLEQLLAESTGKEGTALIPVDRETAGPLEMYGDDRVFVYVRLESSPDPSQDTAIEALKASGEPVVQISVKDPYTLGEEFFRWEIATAVAGSIMGINPFNQPDVEASKIATRELTEAYEETGSLPPESPVLTEGPVSIYTDEKNANALADGAGANRSLSGYIKAHLNRLSLGDYFALLAYIEMNEKNEEGLQSIRMAVRDRKKVATCLGFGPRFLHSTGQAYKGGPNTGVFLQITGDDSADLKVPHQNYTFGIVKAAQARGDFTVLADRNRRVMRVHLGSDIQAGLSAIEKAIMKALK